MTDQQASIGRMFKAGEGNTTFLGLPAAAIGPDLEAEVAILGVPIATSYRSVGAYCAGAPAAIRAGLAGYSAARHHWDFDLGGPLLGEPPVRVVDCGDLDCDETDFAGNRAAITAAVAPDPRSRRSADPAGRR